MNRVFTVAATCVAPPPASPPRSLIGTDSRTRFELELQVAAPGHRGAESVGRLGGRR
jgi:hypothetical protein